MDYDKAARDLLGDTLHHPTERSRRICALYACFYLEEPLLHAWCGLASFVSRQIYYALEDDSVFTRPFDPFFAGGNIEIYLSFVPALLRFRDGAPETDPRLAPGMDLLARARDATDPARAHAFAEDALAALSEAEQALVVQPLYDRLPSWKRRYLGYFYHFRLGWDSAAPVIRFPGSDPGDLDQRRAWMKGKILPAWRDARATRFEAIRRDCDENRRDAGLRAPCLPAPKPFLPVVPGVAAAEVGAAAATTRPSPSPS